MTVQNSDVYHIPLLSDAGDLPRCGFGRRSPANARGLYNTLCKSYKSASATASRRHSLSQALPWIPSSLQHMRKVRALSSLSRLLVYLPTSRSWRPSVMELVLLCRSLSGTSLTGCPQVCVHRLHYGWSSLDEHAYVESAYTVEDKLVPVEGGEIRVRCIVPTRGDQSQTFPVLVWYHSGGACGYVYSIPHEYSAAFTLTPYISQRG